MIDSKWFCETNDIREPWCFLHVHSKKQNDSHVITGWEIGYGNPNSLTRNITNEKSKEQEIVVSLLREINYCRKKKILVITGYQNTLSLIRTRVLLLHINNASFHGLPFLSLEKIIERYFQSNDPNLLELMKTIYNDNKNSRGVNSLYSFFIRLGPLLPEEVFQ